MSFDPKKAAQDDAKEIVGRYADDIANAVRCKVTDMSDADKLRLVADWLDVNDRQRGDLGKNDVQRDLRRIDDLLDGHVALKWNSDITAAPKDGRWVLLKRDNGGEQTIYVAAMWFDQVDFEDYGTKIFNWSSDGYSYSEHWPTHWAEITQPDGE